MSTLPQSLQLQLLFCRSAAAILTFSFHLIICLICEGVQADTSMVSLQISQRYCSSTCDKFLRLTDHCIIGLNLFCIDFVSFILTTFHTWQFTGQSKIIFTCYISLYSKSLLETSVIYFDCERFERNYFPDLEKLC